MQKIRKGDDVIVITGKDRGKRGTVVSIVKNDYVIVQGINLVKKHQKPNPTNGTAGGIIGKEMPIHASNVAIYNFTSKKPDRVGFKVSSDNNKVRIFKSSGDLIET
ncbi:50S ribosomal protein L24 [Nitrosomonas supralitoralis]|uniref:Large ribosomal subunit protein uL24 n=1 Tax=Nitrosomonas supralitoralis TaxID=2116706 RepID=A0A2P7NX34_9PROT|nr:50S ribosomal protein L24 [Nitrosomonas supralitoralis]PSJ18020.1 50S ribosomal protein L24 [Nitrosomonas supralitoralis]